MEIITNNQARPLYDFYGMTKEGQEWFKDYPNAEEGSYFCYRGNWHSLADFMRTDIPEWDGIETDTYFSATLIRLTNDAEYEVIAARVYT